MSYTITLDYTPATTNTDGNPAKAATKYTVGWDIVSHASDGAYANLVTDVDFTPVASGANAGQQFTKITVPNPGQYFLSVQETTPDGTSGWASELSYTVVAAAPNPPSKLSASSGTG